MSEERSLKQFIRVLWLSLKEMRRKIALILILAISLLLPLVIWSRQIDMLFGQQESNCGPYTKVLLVTFKPFATDAQKQNVSAVLKSQPSGSSTNSFVFDSYDAYAVPQVRGFSFVESAEDVPYPPFCSL
jgi:hypothetical protein